MYQMSTVERLVVLLADVRAERAEGVEPHEILDDVESVLAKILETEPDVPTLDSILEKFQIVDVETLADRLATADTAPTEESTR